MTAVIVCAGVSDGLITHDFNKETMTIKLRCNLCGGELSYPIPKSGISASPLVHENWCAMPKIVDAMEGGNIPLCKTLLAQAKTEMAVRH